MANIYEPKFEDDHEGVARRARLGHQAGTERLGVSLYELAPAAPRWPFHFHHGNEELLVVLSGSPSLRTEDGWRELAEGEVVSFPAGEQGGHQIANRGDEPVRYLMVSTMDAPDAIVYPDSEKVGVMTRPPGSPADAGDALTAWFRLSDDVDYWEGEDSSKEEK